MKRKPYCFSAVALGLGILAAGLPRAAQAQDQSLYGEPDSGWVYTFDGGSNASDGAASLDGTWSHDNGSDSWDGSEIGDGSPGGVSVLDDAGEAYIRMQETGNPTDHDMPDPSNRKISFHRDMLSDGVNMDNGGTFSEDYKPLRDGVTINSGPASPRMVRSISSIPTAAGIPRTYRATATGMSSTTGAKGPSASTNSTRTTRMPTRAGKSALPFR